MRISSQQWFRQSMTSMLEQQASAMKTQEQLATGKRLLKPSDDPMAASRILDVSRAIEKVDQFERNAGQVQDRLQLQETAVDSGIATLQRVRELIVQANNGVQSDETREMIAVEVESLRNALTQQANARDGVGKYLFGGIHDDQPPYMMLGEHALPVLEDAGGQRVPGVLLADGSLAPAMLDVVGLPIPDPSLDPLDFHPLGNGQRQIQTSASTQMADADPATSVFQYGAGASRHDILTTVTALAQALQKTSVAEGTVPVPAGSLTPSQRNAALSDGLAQLDRDIGHLSDVRTGLGVRLNQLDLQADVRAETSIQMRSTLSSLEDVDYAEAVGRLNQQLTGMQAAQQVFVKVQGLSLFNYL